MNKSREITEEQMPYAYPLVMREISRTEKINTTTTLVSWKSSIRNKTPREVDAVRIRTVRLISWKISDLLLVIMCLPDEITSATGSTKKIYPI